MKCTSKAERGENSFSVTFECKAATAEDWKQKSSAERALLGYIKKEMELKSK